MTAGLALQQMAPQTRLDDFSVFQIEKLVDNSTTDFDLFLNVENHFILYSGLDYRWSRHELTELLRAGHAEFFIRKGDLAKAHMYETIVKIPMIEKNLPPPERIQSLTQVGAKFIQCLYEGDLTPTCIRKAETIATTMVECIQEDRSCIKYLSGLADHDYYTYFHSIRVSSYAVAIAVEMGLSDTSMLQAIALGGIFHDIGKKDVPITVINKSGPLTDAEWKMMRHHPTQGHSLVSETILAHVPREIILHHHEKRNGAGYPHGLDEKSLLMEVQIATIADIFDALTSSRTYQQSRSRYEALDFMKHRLLKDDLSPEAFKGLIMCLAI